MKVFLQIVTVLILWTLQDKPVVIKLNNKPHLFTTDKLGNTYVYAYSQLKKYDRKGMLISSFSRMDLGELYAIDATDPMQILLFYKDFNQILFLDNKLSALGKSLMLDELNLTDVSAVCNSKQQAVWIFDQYQKKLIHYSFNPRGIIQSINLDKYSKEIKDINFMLENGNELYLNQKNKAIWVFDVFGSRLQKYDILIDKSFQVLASQLIYHNHKQIFFKSLLLNKTDSLNFTDYTKFTDVRINSDHVYLLNADSISIFPILKD